MKTGQYINTPRRNIKCYYNPARCAGRYQSKIPNLRQTNKNPLADLEQKALAQLKKGLSGITN